MEKDRFLKILEEIENKKPMDVNFSEGLDYYDGRLEPILEAVKQYTSEYVKESLRHLLENPVGEHCFIHISASEDENNIILL